MFSDLLGRVIDQGGMTAAVAILAGWVIWKFYLFFDARESNLRGTFYDREQKLLGQVNDLQVALTETSMAHHQQQIEAHKDFTNRLLSLVTSDAETRERTIYTLAELRSAMKRLEGLDSGVKDNDSESN